MKKFLLLFLVSLNIISFSQTNNEKNQLALEYYKNKEFDKAAVLFSELYAAQSNKLYFTYYLNCLVELKDFETAEKIIKKEIKRNGNDLSFYVDLGFIYKIQNKLKDADLEFQKAVKFLAPENNQIILLANQFIIRREYNYAEQTYLKGRKLLKETYGFNFELANLYQSQQMWDKMIDEYLNVLDIHTGYLQSVQNQLQASVYSDKENNLTELLKTRLIRKIQLSPEQIIFSELLIWLYIQESDMENALIQSKAIDKKLKEDGKRIMVLARQAASIKLYDVAIEAYQYVIDKGKFNIWFIEAKNEQMTALYNKVLESPVFNINEIQNLESLLVNTLGELGKSRTTFQLVKALTYIQAFYLGKANESLKELETFLSSSNLSQLQAAECKLLMGDICLYLNDIWSATIYYAQVEKANENEPVGHEAKFRKAKLAYYSGDFLWAQAQLDVLKASTSKLIANDAFSLSMMISNNLEEDSAGTALKMFADAGLLLFRLKDSLAEIVLDSIVKSFRFNTILDDTYFKLGEIYLGRADFNTAIKHFDAIANNYAVDPLADDALFKLGLIHENYLKDKDKAMEYYQKILNDYPGSTYTVTARQHFRMLRGDKLTKEEMFFHNLLEP